MFESRSPGSLLPDWLPPGQLLTITERPQSPGILVYLLALPFAGLILLIRRVEERGVRRAHKD